MIASLLFCFFSVLVLFLLLERNFSSLYQLPHIHSGFSYKEPEIHNLSHSTGLINALFPQVKFICGPRDILSDQRIYWQGICTSWDQQISFDLTIKGKKSKKKFKGIKVGKEFFYLSTSSSKLSLLPGNYVASGGSTFFIGGISQWNAKLKYKKSSKQSHSPGLKGLKGLKNQKNNLAFKLYGLGIGIGLHLDRYADITIKEVHSKNTESRENSQLH